MIKSDMIRYDLLDKLCDIWRQAENNLCESGDHDLALSLKDKFVELSEKSKLNKQEIQELKTIFDSEGL